MSNRTILCGILLLKAILMWPTSLEYHFPRKVEQQMSKWVASQDANEQDKIYFILRHFDNKRFDILCCLGLWEDLPGQLAAHSQRYVSIQGRHFPLLLDYDEKYGINPTQNLSDVGSVGNRDGTVKRWSLLFHGKTISFNFKSKRVSKEFYRTSDKASEFANINEYPIIYVFSDEIEKTLLIETAGQQEEVNSIQLSIGDDGKTIYRWISDPDMGMKSDRVALVGDNLIPLFFDFDEWFSDL